MKVSPTALAFLVAALLCIVPAFAGDAKKHCEVEIDGIVRKFEWCADLPLANLPDVAKYILYWTVQEDIGMINMAVHVSGGVQGYGAIGFPQSSGEMIGSDVVLGHASSNGYQTGMGNYVLTKHAFPTEPGHQKVFAALIDVNSNEKEIKFMFSRPLSPPGAVRNISRDGSTEVVFSCRKSPLSPTSAFHDGGMSSGTINFFTGRFDLDSLLTRKIHGVMAFISFGVLFPVGAIVAATMKGAGPIWFYTHVTLQLIGSIGGLTAFVIGMKIANGWFAGPGSAHGVIGLTMALTIGLQLIAAGARPALNSPKRRTFNMLHTLGAFLLFALTLVNLRSGLHKYGAEDKYYTIVYVIAGPLIGVAFLTSIIAASRKVEVGGQNQRLLTVEDGLYKN